MDRIGTFSRFLVMRGYRPKTVTGYTQKLEHYFQWCRARHIDPDVATLDQLYDYKRECLGKGHSYGYVREKLSVLKHYYQCMGRRDNPALLVKHKKRERTLPQKLFDGEGLRELYRTIRVEVFIHRRDRAILGMVVFQALRRKELQLLEVGHLDINEGTLYVPAMSRSNARTLPLHPAQMGHLMEYLYEFRPKLLTEAGKRTDRLFFSMGGGSTLNNALQIGMRTLRRDCPAFRSLEQVRESRMALWVREHGIRKAQYLSGIKYASSMLRYMVTDIEELQKKLGIVHPMERL